LLFSLLSLHNSWVTPDSRVSQQQKQTQGRDTVTTHPIWHSISPVSLSTLKSFQRGESKILFSWKRYKNILHNWIRFLRVHPLPCYQFCSF